MDAARSILLSVPWSAVENSSVNPFQNVRLDRRVKRAHLEQSGVKSTADRIDVIAEVFVRGNEHRVWSFNFEFIA